jgi:hypothetical protein
MENLLAAFAGTVTFDRATPEYFHPGRSARAVVNGMMLAQFGEIHPEIVSARKLRQQVFLAEFDLEQLYRLGLRPVRFEPLPKYPAVERDFSFVFGDDVTFEQIERAVDNTDCHRKIFGTAAGKVPVGREDVARGRGGAVVQPNCCPVDSAWRSTKGLKSKSPTLSHRTGPGWGTLRGESSHPIPQR